MLIARISGAVLAHNLQQLGVDELHLHCTRFKSSFNCFENSSLFSLLKVTVGEDVEDLENVDVVGQISLITFINPLDHLPEELAVTK